MSGVPSNAALIAALREADRAAGEWSAMFECFDQEASSLCRAAFKARLRLIRGALEWAIADLSVPSL